MSRRETEDDGCHDEMAVAGLLLMMSMLVLRVVPCAGQNPANVDDLE